MRAVTLLGCVGLLLLGCGQDVPARDSADAEVAGPAMFTELRRIMVEDDALALWARLSDEMRAEGRRQLGRDLEKAATSARKAKSMEEELKLGRSPVGMTVDDILLAFLRTQLESIESEEVDRRLGVAFLRAERRDDVMIVVTKRPEDADAKAPNGELELIFFRQGDRWAVDKRRQAKVRSRWLREIDVGMEMDGEGGLAFTPDGSRVVVYGRRGVFLVPWEEGSEEKPLHLSVAHVNSVAIDPGGEWIATSARGGPLPKPVRGIHPSEVMRTDQRPEADDPHAGVMLWRLPSGAPHKRLVADCGHIAVSPDGKQLLMVDGEDHRGAWVWDVATGEGDGLLNFPLQPTGGFLADGRIVVRGNAGPVRVLDATGELVQKLDVGTVKRGLAIHAGTNRIAIGANRDRIRILDATSGEDLEFAAGRRIAHNAFSPDGTQILAEYPVARYDVATGTLLRRIRPMGFTEAPAFHPDGRHVVVFAKAYQQPDLPDPGDRLHVFDATE